LEITEEIALEKGYLIDKEGFIKLLKQHQEISRKGMDKKFKSGLADHSEKTIKYHTATHILHQALREVLGDKVEQRGSNITEERLRFDFSYPTKLTKEQISQVEDKVNEVINQSLEVTFIEMSINDARASGAIGLFGSKYGDKVKVYSIGNYSKEMCTGPHVENTKVLGKFQITKEEASSTGIRRIKAILT